VTSEDQRRRILADLDERQREAVTTPRSPLLVVAGAGSGKTRVLSRRIAWRAGEDDAFASHALALTFTRRAAAELRSRLHGLGLSGPVTAGTFHAVALAELRRRALDTGRAMPVVLDARLRLLSEVLARGFPHWSRREHLGRVAGEIDWAKARRIPPARYVEEAERSRRGAGTERAEIALAYGAYETEKRRRGVLDLDDLLERLVEEIESDVDFAAAQRWRFRHFFVDELQDANPAQLALLDCWLGGRPDLFGVGDPRQSIYGWNGSDPGAVTAFAVRYPGALVLELDANYRSTPEIVTVASSVLEPVSIAPTPRPSGPVPTISAYPEAEAEAEAVAAAIRRAWREGRPWRHVAVLARTNAQLSVLEGALRSEDIPLSARNGAAFLSRPAVREALRGLRRSSDATRFALFVADLDPLSSPPATDRGAVEGHADRRLLLELASQYRDLDPRPTGAGFIEFLGDGVAESGPGDEDGVTLLTFHRAKGLEWPVVFVTGLEDGLVPIAQARTAEQQAEERRLVYVAMSRASDELHLSWAEQRGHGTGRPRRAPSPYLHSVEDARLTLAAGRVETASVAAQALADSRAALRRGPRRSRGDRDRPLGRSTTEMVQPGTDPDPLAAPTPARPW